MSSNIQNHTTCRWSLTSYQFAYCSSLKDMGISLPRGFLLGSRNQPGIASCRLSLHNRSRSPHRKPYKWTSQFRSDRYQLHRVSVSDRRLHHLPQLCRLEDNDSHVNRCISLHRGWIVVLLPDNRHHLDSSSPNLRERAKPKCLAGCK